MARRNKVRIVSATRVSKSTARRKVKKTTIMSKEERKGARKTAEETAEKIKMRRKMARNMTKRTTKEGEDADRHGKKDRKQKRTGSSRRGTLKQPR